jgi:hypothetical protein
MARNQTGLAITIKAFLVLKPNDINQNLEALTLAKEAHETGDYSKLIASASIDEVKVEQRSRRVEDAPVAADAEEPGPLLQAMEAGEADEPVGFASSRSGISSGEERVDPEDVAGEAA